MPVLQTAASWVYCWGAPTPSTLQASGEMVQLQGEGRPKPDTPLHILIFPLSQYWIALVHLLKP